MNINGRSTKKCPRCGTKCLLSQVKCNECGLVFARLAFASNKEAKKAIKAGEHEKVIKTKEYPSDLKRWKHLILCIFCGLFGVHDIYVGKYIKGIIRMLIFVAAIIITAVGAFVFFEKFFYIPYGIVGIMWLYDIAAIALKFYKVPIALNMPQKQDLRVVKDE